MSGRESKSAACQPPSSAPQLHGSERKLAYSLCISTLGCKTGMMMSIPVLNEIKGIKCIHYYV